MRQHHKAVIFMVCSLFLGKSQLLFGKIQISHTSDKPLIRALMFNKKAKKKDALTKRIEKIIPVSAKQPGYCFVYFTTTAKNTGDIVIELVECLLENK